MAVRRAVKRKVPGSYNYNLISSMLTPTVIAGYRKLAQKQAKRKKRRSNSGWYESHEEPVATFNPPCSLCGSPAIKNGQEVGWRDEHNKPIQRYKCKTCGKSFTKNTVVKKDKPEVAIAVDVDGNITGEVVIPKKIPAKKASKKLTKEQETIRDLKKQMKENYEKQSKTIKNLRVHVKTKDATINKLQKEVAHLKETGYFPPEPEKDKKKNTRYVTINDM